MTMKSLNKTNSRDYTTTYRYYEVFETEDDWVLFLSRYTTCIDVDKVSMLGLLLRNRFYNSTINYDTKEAFMRHFGLTFSNIYRKYLKQLDIIDKIHDLSDEDIVTAFKSISNMAKADARGVENPLGDVIDYIDAQSSSRNQNNVMAAYVGAIYRMTDELVYDFLRPFNVHFASVYFVDIVDPDITYNESEEE